MMKAFMIKVNDSTNKMTAKSIEMGALTGEHDVVRHSSCLHALGDLVMVSAAVGA